jgi:hypothetical protein
MVFVPQSNNSGRQHNIHDHRLKPATEFGTSPQPLPIYLDWTFWATALAFVAIVLSQIPPVHLLLRPKRLEVEVHSRIRISHMVGNPNASVVVSVRNTGGRQLRIRGLRLLISRAGKSLLTLPGLNYYETPSAQTAVLFVPFSLKPGETWAHNVTFLNEFDRQTEKLFRESSSALAADIRRKIADRAEDDTEAVVADPLLVVPFQEMFNRLFVWQPDEYVATLEVQAEPGSASFSKKYRFTLYESDTRDLVENTSDYKYGGGITFKLDAHGGVNVPISEHIG